MRLNPPQLRLLKCADLCFADALRRKVGWNQTMEDWERFLSLEPQGCFLAECNGEPAGTATTVVYSRELAWIGMVLVHPDHRRRGLGRALLNRSIGHLRGRGVRCIKLDATPLGQPVYDRLGFKAEWTLTRWEREPASISTGRGEKAPVSQPWSPSALAAIDALDMAAFGVSRQRLLQSVAGLPGTVTAMESEAGGGVAGYGWLRPGAEASYLGPLVAKSSEVARRILEELLERGRAGRIFWDIPDANDAAISLARKHDFTVQRTFTRMFLGQNQSPGLPSLQFAIAGPECG